MNEQERVKYLERKMAEEEETKRRKEEMVSAFMKVCRISILHFLTWIDPQFHIPDETNTRRAKRRLEQFKINRYFGFWINLSFD